MKKRIVSLFVLLMIVGLAGAMPVMAETYPFVRNDTDNYIEIASAADLTAFSAAINNGTLLATTNARLMKDIVLHENAGSWGTTPPADTTQWTPIGRDAYGFRYNGTFDGAGYTVSGIYINATSGPQGLFGTVENQAKIKNLGVINSWIKGTGANSDIGGVVGRNYGSVSNCYNTGTVSNGTAVGGVVGSNLSTITNCYNTGSVRGIASVGGVAGSSEGADMQTISNCYNTGTVSGTATGVYIPYNMVGGVVGSSMDSTISNCYNTGAVTGSSNVGGVVGEAEEGVTNCYYADVSVAEGKTGIGGRADAPGSTVKKDTDAFAFGEVAWLLQKGQTVPAPQVWGQKLADPTKDLRPVLTNDPVKKVVRVTLDYDGPDPDQFLYCAVNGKIELPDPEAGTIYTYTKTDAQSNTYNQTEMKNYVITNDETFTVKKYQLTEINGVIQIGTPAQLTDFSRYVNDGNTEASAVLTDNIVLRPTTGWDNWSATQLPSDLATNGQWIPIGTDEVSYNGTFDGAGHTVSGIYINSSDDKPQGLFGTSEGTIENLGVIESWINSSRDVGNQVNVKSGGVVGRNSGSVSNCYNTGTVSNGTAVGGVVGQNTNGTISNCHNTGTVSGSSNVGGVVGQCKNGTISNCYNTGEISGTATGDFSAVNYVGGVVGSTMSCTITNCYNIGRVRGSDGGSASVGGVAGSLEGLISNCYNTGTVSGNSFVGGVAGSLEYGSISNCYNTGAVSGSPNVGGVAGSAMGGISNCYYLDDLNPLGSTAAKSTAAFTSGEVAWLLQNPPTDPEDPTEPVAQVWGQKLVGTPETPKDAIPLLKTADPVCKITYLKGDATNTYKVDYVNQNQTITPVVLSDGYIWKDSNQDAFTGVIPDKTKELSVHCGIETLPTATANFGKKLSEIPFTGGSVDATKWSWSESVDNLNLVPAFGNTTAYKATYTSGDPVFGTVQIEIIPTIAKSLTDAGVSVSLAADSYTVTGAAITPAVTVTDTGTTLTASDYTVIYTNNINPGTATVTVTGQGNYVGIVTKNFTITSSGGGGGGGYTPPAPPAMPGVVVNPGTITFDPAGHLAVDITGAPAGSVVYYSLDGITFTTTPPAMENAGEHTVYVKVSSPGYQDFVTQTTVTVDKHAAPVIPEVSVPVPAGQQSGSTDLGALLPPNRGQIRYQLVSVNDPREILSGPPSIDQNGMISYGFARPLSASGEQLTASATTDNVTSSATITVLVTMQNYADTTIILVVSAEEAFGVQYQTHIQDIGWETDWKTDGALSGTEGQSKRLEALKVELTGDVPAGATIDTEVHVQNYGNMGPFAMGSAAGTSGEGLRLENICLTLKSLPGYTILYNVHVQNQGWLRDENDSSTWFKSGETAGTSALSLRLEGIRIKLVKSE